MHSLPALYVDGVEDRNNSTLKPEVQIDCDGFFCVSIYILCVVLSLQRHMFQLASAPPVAGVQDGVAE